jgi:sterol desaturase/sphingolipid hydroxylase (fatty acid hydroxylase superfamily)
MASNIRAIAGFYRTAEHAHPIEFLFCNYMPLMSGPVLFPHHPVTFWVWVAWRVILASEIHSGYNFPWNLERYFSIYAGPIHHDRHHESFNGNYASSLKWLDWVFGTHITTPRKVRLSKNKKGGDSVSKEAPAESLLKEE